MKGAYLLVMILPQDTSVLVGKQGVIHFQKGCYVYVGSALNGLEQRIARHLRSNKKIHWHVDYLLSHMELVEIFYKENTRREECTLAQALNATFKNVPGVGSSDCSCPSHLFVGSPDAFRQAAASLHMDEYPLDETSWEKTASRQ
jgi:Uri superfamily endonuclease